MIKKHNIAILIAILLISIYISLCLGTKNFDVFHILISKNANNEIYKSIILNIRLPRILICIMCGSLLSGVATVFQGFFRNPLADSTILGIASGASFGAVLSLYVSTSTIFIFSILQKFIAPINFFAFIGAVISSLIVFSLTNIFKSNSSVHLLLCGVATSAFFSAITSLCVVLSKNQVGSFYSWTTGSFNAKGWTEFFIIIIPFCVSTVMLLFCAKPLDLLICGETSAISLGLDYNRFKNYVLITGAVATSTAVVAGGVISFLGLISSHVARKIFGLTHKGLIIYSMLIGSIMLLAADTFSRFVIRPKELPVGILTSVIGAVFMFCILVKEK